MRLIDLNRKAEPESSLSTPSIPARGWLFSTSALVAFNQFERGVPTGGPFRAVFPMACRVRRTGQGRGRAGGTARLHPVVNHLWRMAS